MRNVERIITFALIIAASVFGVINWRSASLFKAQNENLQARLTALEKQIEEGERGVSSSARELDVLRQRSAELMKLRNEVTQLRAGNQALQQLQAENQRLKQQLQQRGGEGAMAELPVPGAPGADHFPRESWKFAGYASPQSALVSAIWAMREGNPQTYLDSLSPNEQQRMALNWQNMSQEQIMAKHKSDVANITGLRVLEQQNLAPDEIVMNVYLEGPGRVEKVRMNQVGQEWKFAGFVTDPQQQQPQPAPQQPPGQ